MLEATRVRKENLQRNMTNDGEDPKGLDGAKHLEGPIDPIRTEKSRRISFLAPSISLKPSKNMFLPLIYMFGRYIPDGLGVISRRVRVLSPI